MDYFAPPRTKMRRCSTYWRSSQLATSLTCSQWEPYQDDKVRDRASGHVVTFATSQMRDRWLLAQHPTLHSKRKDQNTTIAMAEGKGLA